MLRTGEAAESGTPEGPGVRAAWQAAAVGTLTLLLTVLHQFSPLFWYRDDKRNQYVPIFQDIGRRVLSGELPTIDPDLGPSGNYALDTQYSVYDPLHLLVGVLTSRFDNLAVAGFVLALVFLSILAWGSTALVQRLGVRGAYAPMVGLATATSGFVFFYLAPNWIPGAIGLAFVPWLWWAWLPGDDGLVRVRRLPLVALFSYWVIASGWPSTWIVFVGLTIGFAVEAFATRDGGLRSWAGPLILRALPAVAGGLVAVIGLLPIIRAASWTIRDNDVTNNNGFIVNLADLLGFAMPSLHGDLRMFGGAVTSNLPIYFAGWFLLALVCLLRWDRIRWTAPGTVTGSVGLLVLLLATQLPSTLGPVRDQFRQLAGVQLFAVVLVSVVAWRAGLTLRRGRVVALVLAWSAMTFLAWARTPGAADWALGALAVAAALAVVVLAHRWAGLRGFAYAGVAGTLVLTSLALGLTLGGRPTDKTPPSEQANDEAGVRARPGPLALSRADGPTYALYPKASSEWDRWFDEGLGRSFAHLTADARMMPGYSSVSQQPWRTRFSVRGSHGDSRASAVGDLFATDERTGRTWAELLGLRTIVVHRDWVPRFRRLSPVAWSEVRSSEDFVVFQRAESPAVTGRITYAAPGIDVQATAVANASQTYRVDAPEGGLLVLRDVFWPGYHATLDGEPLPVRPYDDTLVSVELPAGSDGTLQVEYAPVRAVDVALLGGAALVLLAGSMAAGRTIGRRRRSSTAGSGPSGDPQST